MNKINPGRKPKPTNLHLLHGTYNPTRHGRDREGEIQPEPINKDIEAPPTLSQSAKEHWHTIMASLSEANILANMDVDALALYCENWAQWAEANAHIEKYGMVIKSPKDNKTPVVSPYLSISLKTGDQLRRLLTEFGMTPASRVGLKGKNTEQEPEERSFGAWEKNRTNKGA